ncbi:MAG TPA: ThiF family adenylyltransferase [Baekduia sp.]|uniref:ThiF family adenylyltransferase n=1 Tax=Baekduia sp. TaxID=2600305 RepID=UPI002BB23548|nr:ThiF family adenylyltransferase [Baekduia sp.]HMJ35619.1 ThiF family adenylyltransferase [Baekduia sp.]
MTREEFEREFHSRTLAYQSAYRADTRPVVVHVGDDAHTPVGHALLVGLVNQLARAHQHLVIIGATDDKLLSRATFAMSTTEAATMELARAINPFITTGTELAAGPPLVTIAIGKTAGPVDLRVGCVGWCATFGPDAHIDTTPTSLLGAMLGSSIAATFAFHRLLGPAAVPGPSYSLWHYGRPGVRQGPALSGPLDVGRVLQVGAGGVGAALDFWLALLGVTGNWMVCDGDLVDISNLNRQLAFLAHHAGFPDPPARNKATMAAELLGSAATADPHWYGETPTVVSGEFDVVLALANEHGARAALQARQAPVLLHATTSANWEAQFHRHVAGHDDCIACRLPETAPRLRCAETRVNTETGTDAALPFLSGAAGLLLLTGLIRLQHDELITTERNFMSLNLAEPAATAQQLRRNCSDGCSHWAPPRVRQRIGVRSRYARLDPARAQDRG